MKMLLIMSPGEVDQIIMFVEDDYDKGKAERVARNYLSGDPYISEEVEIADLPFEFCTWRPYIG